jgi:1-pyrroline-5-carboxylate dehydrogenase
MAFSRFFQRAAPRRAGAVAKRTFATCPPYATLDPYTISGSNPCTLYNLEGGEWKSAQKTISIPDPLNGEPFVVVPDTQVSELGPFLENAKSCPKSGLHNPLKNPERYVMYGEIMHQAGHELSSPDTHDFFARLIQRTMPKSYQQAWYEVKVTADFFKNFGGDNPRFNAGGQQVAGDREGQNATNWRWPFGPVCIVSPFNFPLEIPTLQLGGALMMGNRPTLKCDSVVAPVMEQLVRMLIHCGMPATDMDLLHSDGPVAGELIGKDNFRVTQFTGSSTVAELLAEQTNGKVRLEDAGFDWKILGPDVGDVDYVAWQADMDAYACSGQKCSAQSILFAHKNWADAGIYDKLEELAGRRQLSDLSVGPVMTHTTENMLGHMNRLLEIPGAKCLFGGKALEGHTIPDCYGAIEPTAVFVPLDEMLRPENFKACCTEIFGPFQVVTEFDDDSEAKVLEACETMSNHLTAAVVSNDPRFQARMLKSTVNGTTYTGRKARTTGAPQNHWFGPAGDPRGAGIGTPYAIQLVWSCHREIIYDEGEVPADWVMPEAS